MRSPTTIGDPVAAQVLGRPGDILIRSIQPEGSSDPVASTIALWPRHHGQSFSESPGKDSEPRKYGRPQRVHQGQRHQREE